MGNCEFDRLPLSFEVGFYPVDPHSDIEESLGKINVDQHLAGGMEDEITT